MKRKNRTRQTGKRKKIISIFAIVAFMVGFLFLDNSTTGNVISNKGSPLNVLSLIGLLLIFCSAILTFYAVKKK